MIQIHLDGDISLLRLDVVQHHSPRVLYSIRAASNCARLLRKALQSGSEVDRTQVGCDPSVLHSSLQLV